MECQVIRRKLESDENSARIRDASNAQVLADNSLFIKKNDQIIKSTSKNQDKLLDDLGTAIDRLTLTSRGIHTEIKEQTVLVDNLGKDMDHAGDKMGVVLTAANKMLKSIRF